MVNGVIGSYVRAQLLSATAQGVMAFIGLSVLGIKFAAILGLVAGLFGLIPIIGPLLGAVPGCWSRWEIRPVKSYGWFSSTSSFRSSKTTSSLRAYRATPSG